MRKSLQKLALAATLLLSGNAVNMQAQEAEKGYDIYGYVRTDFFAQSRNNVNSVNDLFALYAAPEGDQPSAGMQSITTRMGADFYAEGILGAKRSVAKIEADFSGGTDNVWVRLRQAYTQLQWEHSSLLMGQTWHPMFTSHIMPSTMNINTGSPYNPFNRSPQFRYNLYLQDFTFTAAAIYQTMYKSAGPNGASAQYLKNAVIPNMFLGAEYHHEQLTLGVGGDYKALKPLTEVDKLLHSFSGIAYANYQKDKFRASAKVLYGQNLSEHNIIGGYYIDVNNHYTNYQSFASYANICYGNLHKCSFLAGYSANLGPNAEVPLRQGKFYGFGVYQDKYIGDMYRVSLAYMYQPENWRLGAELEYNKVTWCDLVYGQLAWPNRTDALRLTAAAVYFF